MKRKIAAVLSGVLAAALLMSGCEQSKGLETDALKITQYKDVEVSEVKKPEEVTDEDVENAIDSTLEARAEKKEVKDRAVKDGDIVNIDFTGKMDGKKFDGGSAEGYDLTIGSGSFIDGFEDSIIDHKIGDKFDWNGKFPDNYRQEDLAGKDVTFTIKVNAITENKVPELTDKLVAELSEKSKTVDEYKDEVKNQLAEEAETSYKNNLSSELWDAILENTTVKEYPEGKKEEVAKQLKDNYKQMADSYGMEFADFLTQMNMTEEQFNEQADKAAEQSVKMQMVTEAIAEKENIKLDDETYEKELQKIADTYGYESVDELKKQASEEDLKYSVLNTMVGDWLTENCIQVAE